MNLDFVSFSQIDNIYALDLKTFTNIVIISAAVFSLGPRNVQTSAGALLFWNWLGCNSDVRQDIKCNVQVYVQAVKIEKAWHNDDDDDDDDDYDKCETGKLI